MKKTLTLTVCFVFLMALTASARTLMVGGLELEFQSVQAAIDAAAPGDLIQISKGVYRESLVIDKDGLDIVGAGSGQTVIESSGIVVNYRQAQQGRLEGLTLRYVGTDDLPALMLDHSSPLVVNNEITGATLSGVEIQSNAEPVLLNNRIHDNGGSGVLVYLNAKADLMNNTIESNGLDTRHAGVEVRGGASATLRFNKVLLSGGSGVFLHEGARAQLVGNSLIGNALHGVAVLDGASAQIVSNSIWWNTEVGIRVKQSRDVSISGNFIAHNLVGLLVNEFNTPLPQEANNLFLVNTRDTRGIGLSTQDLLLSEQVVTYPDLNPMLQALGKVGEVVQSLKQTDPAAELGATLISTAQSAELFGADLFRLTGLVDEAKTRYQIVIQLDLNSQTANEARTRLEALAN